MLQKHSNICNSLTKHSTIYYKTVLSTYMYVFYTFFKNLPEIRAIPEKKTGRGRQQEIYFSMGVCCKKFSNYMGHCLVDYTHNNCELTLIALHSQGSA